MTQKPTRKMKSDVRNFTKKTVVAASYRMCSSVGEKALGLMFTFSFPNKSLLFTFKQEKRHALHMCFVFYPIDVLFLNRNKEVVDIRENFLPWTFYTPKSSCVYILELPKGAIKSSKTRIGNRIIFS